MSILQMRAQYRGFLIRLALLTLLAVSVTSCARFSKYEYAEHVFALDEENELVISTFSSWFPETQTHIPFIFRSYKAPQSVYFQFYVRATGTVAGPNPNIESILVRNFSYEFPGQEPMVLMKAFTEGFWQQGQQAYDSEQLEPVLCYEGWYVLIKYDLILNGEVFQGEHKLPAQRVVKTYPLIYDALR
ncbi:hypothetical protein [Marinobacter sp. ATCH36]|uniref:hypothetical protein n=1 Tax=Marinobacter sp. ATCH36 TaxID=2945106 RepID=UPI0020219E07|nr:hypothetical protein [Marinobacter sp. ATCH36]MCL7943950.1 hypothetical protein [Marinobacter sp. ATCH36]